MKINYYYDSLLRHPSTASTLVVRDCATCQIGATVIDESGDRKCLTCGRTKRNEEHYEYE